MKFLIFALSLSMLLSCGKQNEQKESSSGFFEQNLAPLNTPYTATEADTAYKICHALTSIKSQGAFSGKTFKYNVTDSECNGGGQINAEIEKKADGGAGNITFRIEKGTCTRCLKKMVYPEHNATLSAHCKWFLSGQGTQATMRVDNNDDNTSTQVLYQVDNTGNSKTVQIQVFQRNTSVAAISKREVFSIIDSDSVFSQGINHKGFVREYLAEDVCPGNNSTLSSIKSTSKDL